MSVFSKVAEPNLLQVKSVAEVYSPNMGKYVLKRLIEKEEDKLVFINQVDSSRKKNLNGVRKIADTIDWNEFHTYTKIKNAKITYGSMKFFNSTARDFVLEKVKAATFGEAFGTSWAHVTMEYFSEAEYLSYAKSETNLYTKNGKLSAKSEVGIYAHSRTKGALITLVRRGKNLASGDLKIAGNMQKIEESTNIASKKFSFNEVTKNFTVTQHYAEFINVKQDIYKVKADNFYITDLKDSRGKNVVVFIEEIVMAKDIKTKNALKNKTTSQSNASSSSAQAKTVSASNSFEDQNKTKTEETDLKKAKSEEFKPRAVYYLDRKTGNLSLITKDYQRPTVFVDKNSGKKAPTAEQVQEDFHTDKLSTYFNILQKV